jgi:hypothetical protein
MKSIKLYIYILLFSIFIQNDTVLVDFLKNMINPMERISYLQKEEGESRTEEDSEKSEKDTEEKEKEENKEKEKEYKNIKSLNTFSCLSAVINLPICYNSEDAKIFIQYFEIETPPPQG